MTFQNVRLKIVTPKLKLHAVPRISVNLAASSPILLNSNGSVSTFSLDINALESTLSALFEPLHAHIDQHITAGASATVQTNAETVRVDKTVGSATTLTMPPASTMLFPVLVVDWKGDAGTNNITINPTGSEKIQGLSSWTIAADNGSVLLRPIPGVGFAL